MLLFSFLLLRSCFSELVWVEFNWDHFFCCLRSMEINVKYSPIEIALLIFSTAMNDDLSENSSYVQQCIIPLKFPYHNRKYELVEPFPCKPSCTHWIKNCCPTRILLNHLATEWHLTIPQIRIPALVRSPPCPCTLYVVASSLHARSRSWLWQVGTPTQSSWQSNKFFTTRQIFDLKRD